LYNNRGGAIAGPGGTIRKEIRWGKRSIQQEGGGKKRLTTSKRIPTIHP